MLDDLFDEIRHFLNEGEQADPDLLGEIAAEYAREVDAVNRRLREVNALLKKGLRSEALELAERSPALRDAIDQLVQPENDAWFQLLNQHRVPCPPKLRTELAEELEHAYDESHQMDQLLRRHRRLALARAPLSERIRILRKIRDRDPANPAWRGDIELWERSRLKQMESEVEQAAQESDVATVQRLRGELESGWTAEVPGALRSRIAMQCRALSAQEARTELLQLSTELNESLTAFDADRGQRARDRWNKLLPIANVTPEEPLIRQTAEALRWLAEEDQRVSVDASYRQAILDLERALEERVALPELERALYAVEKLERPLAPAISARASRYRDALIVTHRRRFRLLVATLIVFLATAATLLGVALVQSRQRRELDSVVEHIRGFQGVHDFPQASEYFHHLPPIFKDHPKVASEWGRIEGAHTQEIERAQGFQRLLEEIERETKDVPRLDRIKELKGLASTPKEKADVDSMERKLRTRQRELQQQFSESFLNVVAKLAQRLKAIEGNGNPKSLRQLLVEMKAVKSKFGGTIEEPWTVLPGHAYGQLDPLISRAQGLLDQNAKALQQGQLQQAVTRAVGKLPEFVAALGRLRDGNVGAPLKADLALTLNESSTWQAFEAWHALAREPAWGNLNQANMDATKKLSANAEALRKEAPRMAIALAFDPVRDLLKKVWQQSEPDAKNHLEETAAYFDEDKTLMRQLYVVVSQQGGERRQYYCVRKPSKNNIRVNFQYYPSVQMAASEQKDLRLEDVAYEGRAPHCEVSGELALLIRSTKGGDELLRNSLLKIVNAAIEENGVDREGADPVPFTMMASWLIEKLPPSDARIAERLNAINARAKASNLPKQDWFKGNDFSIAGVRDKCRGILVDLRTICSDWKSRATDEMKLQQAVATWRKTASYGIVGWLVRDGNGTWTIMSPKRLPENTVVYCLAAGKNAGPIGMRRCGVVKAGHLTEVAEDVVQQGRPVYVDKRT